MDIQRPDQSRKRRRLRILYSAIAVIVLAGISLAVSRLKPAPPTVDRGTVWIDTVQRGDMLRQVRGLGTLVPEEISWIPAQSAGRIEQRLVLPGTAVKADTVLLVMSNPSLKQQALSAKYAYKAAQANYTNLKAQLDAQLMAQRATLAQAISSLRQSQVQLDSDRALAKKGLVSQVDFEVSEAKNQGLATDAEMEKERLAADRNSETAQLASAQTKIAQANAEYELKRSLVDGLTVRAGISGVLQDLPVEVGQQVTAGAVLAKVAVPEKLKAQLQIAETDAKDIALGQPARIDTHNGIIPGRVIRIDPAVQNGTVTVDCALLGPLPPGARPDLSVEGTIQLQLLKNVIYVGRPAFGQANSQITLFRLVDGGRQAVRTKVQIGQTSVNDVQVLRGLQPGEQVILSDMSAWDRYNRVALK
ncbi:MAG: efflux RND transporter periplasmic adaptor subunit [Terriglobales bacterium]